MILGPVSGYHKYQHIETGTILQTNGTELLIKVDREWQQAVVYYDPEDANHQQFAVPIDDFRRRFQEVPKEVAKYE